MSAADQGQGDYIKGQDFEKELFAQELEHIRNQHKDIDKGNLFGLAFSGGGIRSAIFSLGVMQALAEMGWLKRFHYLSTVSGGSYIGASLTWLLHKVWKGAENSEVRFDTGAAFPYKRFHGGKGPQAADHRSHTLIRHLRQHAEYLKPGDGITIWSLLAVILRGTLLSLLVFIPPLMLVLAAGVCVGAFGDVSGLNHAMIDVSASRNSGDIALYHMLQHMSFLGDIARWNIQVAGRSYEAGLNPVLASAIALAALFAMVAVYYGFKTTARMTGRQAYDLRRLYETRAAVLLKVILGLLVIGSLPLVAGLLGDMQGRIASSLSVSGAMASVLAIIKGNSGKQGRVPVGLIAPLALGLLVYGLLLLMFVQAACWHTSIGFWVLLSVLVVLSLALGFKVNINYVSIHRYYRDRLMELFLPDAGEVLTRDYPRAAYAANETCVDKMCDYKGAAANGPYHLINCNMVTIDSHEAKLRARGGDNFIFSPLYCGSEATGWRMSSQYMNGGLNLATATAISGAAADPHGAPGGEGLTRNRSLSLLMALLNVRLGYWAPHPRRTDYATPNWFRQGWHELAGKGMDENEDFVHLADGGHFENLALYELIRRKLRTIVVCDGAADEDFTFVDFANFVEKVRVDFGVGIEVQGHQNFRVDGKQARSLLAMCPRPNAFHPHGVALADAGFVTAAINYSDGSKGTLVYIKTTLIGGLPDDIYSYKRGHDAFPDESTADQFFDEKQFEAYRELGYRIGMTMEKNNDARIALGLKPIKAAAPA